MRVCDRAPRHKRFIMNFLVQLASAARYLALCLRHRDVVLYIALSGGFGQIYDGVYVFVSKVFRRPVVVHHHSFGYITGPNRLNRCIFAMLRNDVHIVLSIGMGQRLAEIYDLDPHKIKVISNAAFYPAAPEVCASAVSRMPLQIGFISNITWEKGIGEFFAVLDQLRADRVIFQARIAGPVDPSIKTQFDRLLASTPEARYVGPVYGEAKSRFYDALDVLLFPTKYVNEAEPLVIHEALRSAVTVIAIDRGAIAEILQDTGGCSFREDQYVQSAFELLRQFSIDRALLARSQRSSREHSSRMREVAVAELERLMSSIVGSTG